MDEYKGEIGFTFKHAAPHLEEPPSVNVTSGLPALGEAVGEPDKGGWISYGRINLGGGFSVYRSLHSLHHVLRVDFTYSDEFTSAIERVEITDIMAATDHRGGLSYHIIKRALTELAAGVAIEKIKFIRMGRHEGRFNHGN